MFALRLGAAVTCRGALDVVGWRQTAQDAGGHEAVLHRVLILGDGATWIWEHVAASFGVERIELVDWYHASQHLWTIAKALHRDRSPATTAWAEPAQHRLWWHGPTRLLAHLRKTTAPTPQAAAV